ncbi:hypothetical protein GCM10027052_12310 [Parafrigoribacterium mesophilum]
MAHSIRANDHGTAVASAAAASSPNRAGPDRLCMAGTTIAMAISTSPTTPRNTQCQLHTSVTAPAATGPISEGMTQAAAKPAKIDGCSRAGNARATTTYRATIMAPVPKPCTRRPATSVTMLEAVPAIRRPAMNVATDV